jgi:hypothetical protein
VQKIPYEAVNKVTKAIENKQYDAGNYMTAFMISGVLCIVAAGVVALVKPPSKAAEAPKA